MPDLFHQPLPLLPTALGRYLHLFPNRVCWPMTCANVPSQERGRETEFCGVLSGEDLERLLAAGHQPLHAIHKLRGAACCAATTSPMEPVLSSTMFQVLHCFTTKWSFARHGISCLTHPRPTLARERQSDRLITPCSSNNFFKSQSVE
jgi:hypothetical protein